MSHKVDQYIVVLHGQWKLFVGNQIVHCKVLCYFEGTDIVYYDYYYDSGILEMHVRTDIGVCWEFLCCLELIVLTDSFQYFLIFQLFLSL